MCVKYPLVGENLFPYITCDAEEPNFRPVPQKMSQHAQKQKGIHHQGKCSAGRPVSSTAWCFPLSNTRHMLFTAKFRMCVSRGTARLC